MKKYQQVWDNGWRNIKDKDDWYNHSSRRVISEKDLNLETDLCTKMEVKLMCRKCKKIIDGIRDKHHDGELTLELIDPCRCGWVYLKDLK